MDFSMKRYKFEPKSLLFLVAVYFCSWGLGHLLEDFVRFSALFELKFFAERINANDPMVWDITFEICFLLAYIICHSIFCITYKSRRKKFIEDTKGLITKKNGLLYHSEHHLLTDAVIILIQTVVYLALFLLKRTLCPVAIIYRLCGLPLGVIVSAVFLIVIHLCHVLWAQYHWRVSHYMSE